MRIHHKGMIYDHGAVYEFSDDGMDWYTGVLVDIKDFGAPFGHRGQGYFERIRVYSPVLGKIRKKGGGLK